MKAGKLRHRAYAYPALRTVTGKGDAVITYPVETRIDCYCSIEPLAGRELLVARGIRADLSTKITCRYDERITHTTRFQWSDGTKTRWFEIGPAVTVDMQNVESSFYAFEIR